MNIYHIISIVRTSETSFQG